MRRFASARFASNPSKKFKVWNIRSSLNYFANCFNIPITVSKLGKLSGAVFSSRGVLAGFIGVVGAQPRADKKQ